MRNLLLALTLLVPMAVHAQAPDQLFTATRLQLDVTKVLLAQEAAWNRGDLDAYLAFYKDAPDTQAILGAPLRGLPAIRSRFHSSFPNRDTMGKLEQSEVEVRAMGDTFGLVTGKYQLTRPKKFGGDGDGTFIEIFEKTSTGWQIIFTETT
jgi:ketosteroid isomerase-like protein